MKRKTIDLISVQELDELSIKPTTNKTKSKSRLNKATSDSIIKEEPSPSCKPIKTSTIKPSKVNKVARVKEILGEKALSTKNSTPIPESKVSIPNQWPNGSKICTQTKDRTEEIGRVVRDISDSNYWHSFLLSDGEYKWVGKFEKWSCALESLPEPLSQSYPDKDKTVKAKRSVKKQSSKKQIKPKK